MNQVGELKGLRRVVTAGTLAGGSTLVGVHEANKHIFKAVDWKQRGREAGSGLAGGLGES